MMSFHDDLFGQFELDDFDHFATDTKWGDTEVELTLFTDTESEVPEALSVAHQLWSDADRWHAKMLDLIQDMVLPLKNNNWLEDGETPLEFESLQKRIMLGHIQVYPDRSFEFVFYDDGIFLEHDIVLQGSLDDGWKNFHLQG